jgi:hypothetical protein
MQRIRIHQRKILSIVYFAILVPTLLACSLLSMMGESAESEPIENTSPDIEAAIAQYETWTRLNEEPYNVSMALWTLCRLPFGEEEAYLASPHAEFYINVYVNELGLPLMENDTNRTFPVGTIIVKEKIATLDNEARNELGIMVKEESGWEYSYWDDGTLYQDPNDVAHCIECHSAEAGGDSVFWPLSAFE